MRGQNTIIRMRLSGMKPSKVWLLALQTPCLRGEFLDSELVIENGGLAEIQIGSDDVIGTLDLRVLAGLTVLLQGTDTDRLRTVFSRLREFNPKRIITSGSDFINDYEPKEELS